MIFEKLFKWTDFGVNIFLGIRENKEKTSKLIGIHAGNQLLFGNQLNGNQVLLDSIPISESCNPAYADPSSLKNP